MFRITLKSIFAHKIRFFLTTVAVVAGVAFVVGSFTLTDSVRKQFNQLFTDINANIDLTVRAQEKFDVGAFGSTRARRRQPVAADPADARRRGGRGHRGWLPRHRHRRQGRRRATGRGPAARHQLVGGAEPVPDDPQGRHRARRTTTRSPSTHDSSTSRVTQSVTPSPSRPRRATSSTRSSGRFNFGEANSLAGAYLVAFTTTEAQTSVQPGRQVPGDPRQGGRGRRQDRRCSRAIAAESAVGGRGRAHRTGGQGEPGQPVGHHQHLRHGVARVRRHLALRRRVPDLQRVPDRRRPARARARVAARRRGDGRSGRGIGAARGRRRRPGRLGDRLHRRPRGGPAVELRAELRPASARATPSWSCRASR